MFAEPEVSCLVEFPNSPRGRHLVLAIEYHEFKTVENRGKHFRAAYRITMLIEMPADVLISQIVEVSC